MSRKRVSANENQENKVQTLLAFSDKLSGVKQVTFHAKSKSKEERWNGKGKGEVAVKRVESHILIL